MTIAAAPSRLQLLAHDAEDLEILSAHVQDAVLRMGDIAYLPRSRRFAMLLNRYRWEDSSNAKASGLRVRAGMHFDGVLGVRARNVAQNDPNAVAELLAIAFIPGTDGGGMIDLCLGGGGRIRLEVECIDATLRDRTGPWPARLRPGHDLDSDKPERA